MEIKKSTPDNASETSKAAALSERNERESYLPPWLFLPDLPYGSLAWRMGEGEVYLDQFQTWFRQLDGTQKRALQADYPATGGWRDFYFNLNHYGMRDVCRAAVIGALVGDALGVPFEFKQPEQLPSSNAIDMRMPDDFPKSHSRIAYGTWSDDGAQLLCLLEALTQESSWPFDAASLGKLLLGWMRSAHHQAGGIVYDCGGQTARALNLIAQGVQATKAGGMEEHSNGNGSLMRCLPVALIAHLHGWTQDEMIDVAHAQSCVTHAHPLAQVCCAAYCLIAYALIHNPGLSAKECYAIASSKLHTVYAHNQQDNHLAALSRIDNFPLTNFRRGSGFVVDSLWTALDSLDRADSYVSVVRTAISYGNDTDTTACIVGGLAGIRYGLDRHPLQFNPLGIPSDWVTALALPSESVQLLNTVFGDGF